MLPNAILSGIWAGLLETIEPIGRPNPGADSSRDLSHNLAKRLILWMEATTGIEPVYTVLQTVA
jgi:hypothetical protein